MNIFIYRHSGPRSETVCNALAAGLRRHGIAPTIKSVSEYPGRPEGDVAMFYGLRDGLREVLWDHKSEAKTAIFFDLGYWGRSDRGKFDGYYRMSINRYHAWDFWGFKDRPSDRFDRFNIQVIDSSNSPNAYILLAGMGPKSAWLYGFEPLEWENKAVEKIQAKTRVPIIYKPKPSWIDSPRVPYTTMLGREISIEEALSGASCLVTHHSNAAIDALIASIPVYGLEDGVAVNGWADPISWINRMFCADLEPRIKFMHRVAYLQWNTAEMAKGKVWDFLKQEGLVS